MISIYTMKLSGIRGKEAALLLSASPRRREKAQRFLREDERLRCLAAGYLMQHCLPGYAEERLRTGRDGKPFLTSGPAFSLSHGGEYVILGVTDEAPSIGVDVEPIREMAWYQPILPRFLTVEEQNVVGFDAEKAVQAWTRKESFYKCVGEGFSDFSELPSVLNEVVFWNGSTYQLKSWRDDGHMFSVALQREDAAQPVEISLIPCVCLL